jgi:predicted RNA polymerase sigma factor
LYEALIDRAPTLGAHVARAATIGRTDGPASGLAALDAIDSASAQRFQPWWATRAHLLAEAGLREEAARAYDKAISLTTEPGVRRYLVARRSR